MSADHEARGSSAHAHEARGSSARAHEARATANANIALAKYWGKADEALNLPAVPSVSITLDPLTTRTRVRFGGDLTADRFTLDGKPAQAKETERVSKLLDSVRAEAQLPLRAEVESSNGFPTASGLASSASGFAALAAAARAAAGLPFDRAAISALARAASVSAARSAFGGYVELPLGTPGDAAHAARPIAAPDHWPLCVVVAVTSEGRKSVGSTNGMLHTARTSPYYASWVELGPKLAGQIRDGILARDLTRVGQAMEHSTLSMHACAMAAAPAVIYFRPATLAVLERVRTLRDDDGVSVWATADAGPHIKALCHAQDAERVARALGKTEGVLRTLTCSPGAGVELEP
jgi:diphosphomevalonate decarboxylase